MSGLTFEDGLLLISGARSLPVYQHEFGGVLGANTNYIIISNCTLRNRSSTPFCIPNFTLNLSYPTTPGYKTTTVGHLILMVQL